MSEPHITHAAFMKLFKTDVATHGGAEMARRIGCPPQHISDVKSGYRSPGPAVLAHYGLEKHVDVVRIVTYSKVKT